jgi:hypothetical protein
LGTVARVVVGTALVGSVVCGVLLRRDDQVGCAPFGPIDLAEARPGRRQTLATTTGADDGR